MNVDNCILEFCLDDFSLVKKDLIKDYDLSEFDIDYELRYVLFLFHMMDNTRIQIKSNFINKIRTRLKWSVTYEHLLIGKIEKQPSYQLQDIKIAKKSLAFASILYKCSYCISLQDNNFTSDNKYFLKNLRDHLFAPSNLEVAENIESSIVTLDGGMNLDLEKIKSQASSIKLSKSEDKDGESLSLDACLSKLNELTGLKKVKEEIKKLVSFLEIQKMREEHKLSISVQTLHMVFTGSPGTGKTTVARIISKIYKALGVLKKGHLIETDRSGLVGQYVGHTDAKTTEVINSALDGILFIDEAYSLYKQSENDFGQEAIDTLVKRLEDDRGRLVVIVAGYREEMDEFINSNPGLRSRFNTYVTFEDFKPKELMDIFKRLCKNGDYVLSNGAKTKLLKMFKLEVDKKKDDFGNGRFVRNTFEKILRNQAMRLQTLKADIFKEDLMEIASQDIIIGDGDE